MAASQILANPSSSGGSELITSDEFPTGLRVLVVDDDAICLKILQKMLHRCSYEATICTEASAALNMLRERKDFFDIVLCDVHMPDMDGYELLEKVRLEKKIPVILMSADGRTSAVMRGIRHGACDYLIKHVREEELKNIWQHAFRKERNENKEHENSGNPGASDRNTRRRNNGSMDDYTEQESDDPSAAKKPRVVWSLDLHWKFINAVGQIGSDKAAPKRILELMDVPGLTRENVASHLQKYRLFLKKSSGAHPQQGGVSKMFSGPVGNYGMQALASSGQVPPQTLTTSQGELLWQPASNLVQLRDQQTLPHSSFQGKGSTPVEHGVMFGQPASRSMVGGSGNASSGFGVWPTTSLAMLSPGLGSTISNMPMNMLEPEQQQNQCPNSSTNLQPSFHVVPSQSLASAQRGNRSPYNQSSGFNRNVVTNYDRISPQTFDVRSNIGQIPYRSLGASGAASGYSSTASLSSSATAASSLQMPGFGPNNYNMQTSSLPNRFAVDQFNLPKRNLRHAQRFNRGDSAGQGPNSDNAGSSDMDMEASVLPRHFSDDGGANTQ